MPTTQPEVADGPVDASASARPKAWYESLWATILTGYVFAPVGIFLMWRYRPWPLWLKGGLTVFGLTMWAVGSYVSSNYIMPRVF